MRLSCWFIMLVNFDSNGKFRLHIWFELMDEFRIQWTFALSTEKKEKHSLRTMHLLINWNDLSEHLRLNVNESMHQTVTTIEMPTCARLKSMILIENRLSAVWHRCIYIIVIVIIVMFGKSRLNESHPRLLFLWSFGVTSVELISCDFIKILSS